MGNLCTTKGVTLPPYQNEHNRKTKRSEKELLKPGRKSGVKDLKLNYEITSTTKVLG